MAGEAVRPSACPVERQDADGVRLALQSVYPTMNLPAGPNGQ
jgi:hypothetical protein